jgi:hypothetical protein
LKLCDKFPHLTPIKQSWKWKVLAQELFIDIEVCRVRPWIQHAPETEIKWKRSGQIYGVHVRPKFWPNSTPSVCERGGESVSRLVNLIVHSIVNCKARAVYLHSVFSFIIHLLMHAHIFGTGSKQDAICSRKCFAACKFQCSRALSGCSKLFELPTLLLFGLGDAPN